MDGHCANHPDVGSVGTCTRCGSFSCAACWDASSGLCTTCVAAGHAVTQIAFEKSVFGFAETLRDVWRSPRAFFARLPDGKRDRAYTFAFLCHTLLYLGVAGTYAIGAALRPELLPDRAEPAVLAATLACALPLAAGIHSAVWTTLAASTLFVAARIAGGKTTYANLYRAVAYGHAYILAYVPAGIALVFALGGVLVVIAMIAALGLLGVAIHAYLRGRAGLSSLAAFLVTIAPPFVAFWLCGGLVVVGAIQRSLDAGGP